ncbi:hypothetical protein ACK8P5_25620 (plasmid) [Paenibacillus sp. EC2-1]|uniref:hypothetical protein n=1 Tax=Paenibacillus sp. EC2-1 TaxID=3388665 RepID=UPI003BEEEC13
MKEHTLIDLQQIESSKPGFNNLYEQIEFGRFNSVKSGAAPTVYQEVYASEGQTEFIMPQGSFTLGDHSLQVYVNGQLQRVGFDNDYMEVNSTTIRFNFGLTADEVVVFRVNGGTSGPSLHENYVAQAGQTIFDLAGSYTTGNHSLVVYVNGAYQTVHEDYDEPSPKRVVFITPLEDGDLVTFRVDGLPSIQSKYQNVVVVNQYDNDNRIIRRETTGDTHIIEEFEYSPEGYPSKMVIREGGYIMTKSYIWVNGLPTEIIEKVREGA